MQTNGSLSRVVYPSGIGYWNGSDPKLTETVSGSQQDECQIIARKSVGLLGMLM